jgi:hypothetical protein
MKTKILVGLVFLLIAAVGVTFLLVQSPATAPSDDEASTTSSGPGQSLEEAARSTPRAPAPQRVRSASAVARAAQVASQEAPDLGPETEPDLDEPQASPARAKLQAEALIRQRDMVKTELQSLRERVPKLRAALERTRNSGGATPTALEQIQTQLQQTVDAVTRLERKLPALEEKVASLPKPASETGAEQNATPAP